MELTRQQTFDIAEEARREIERIENLPESEKLPLLDKIVSDWEKDHDNFLWHSRDVTLRSFKWYFALQGKDRALVRKSTCFEISGDKATRYQPIHFTQKDAK